MKIVIYIYNGMTMLDAIGPYEVLRNLKKADIKLVAKKKGKIISDSKVVHLDAQYGIEEIDTADILLIPGSGLAFVQEAKDKKVLDWIRKINETTQKTVTVCTGSVILAATGLLNGKDATTHWGATKMLTKYGANPVHQRYVEQGKFITAAGVSAGIDMAIYLVHLLQGEKSAKAAQLAIEYDPSPMYDSGNAQTCEPEIKKLAEKQMEVTALRELSFWDKVKQAGSIITMLKNKS